jgi:hypothetical protein
MAKKKLIFDISPLGLATEMSGISRFTIEVLRRLIDRNLFEITLICSNNCEEDALRNCCNILGHKNIPFQSKDVEHYILPSFSQSEKQSKPFFGYAEEFIRKIIPQSDLLDKRIHTAYNQLKRKIKKRIIFTGYVVDTDLPFWYNGAVCFCYMSLYEGFGLPP